MKNRTARTAIMIVLGSLLVALIAACATTGSMGREHPVAVAKPPICSDCHSDWRGSLSHTADFSTRHKFYAAQQAQACGLCHRESFCADCHANEEELKPSDKYKDAPNRAMPHRGDYITQHKIDGRMNPASCFPCHGRQNNERCKVCHK
jgi:hypothetical protein